MTTPGGAHQTPEPWTPSLDTFGARLAAIRQRLGWNVKEAAVACGLPPENWRRWEQENIEPRRLVTIAMAIATRTGVDLDWLVYGPSKPVPAGVKVSREYLPRDPLAPRVIAPVVHHDGRRRPKVRGRTDRSVASATTSTATKRYVPLSA